MAKGDINIKHLNWTAQLVHRPELSIRIRPLLAAYPVQGKHQLYKKQSYFRFLKRSESAVFAFFICAKKVRLLQQFKKFLQIGKNSFLTNLFCRIMILTRIFRTRSSIMLEIAKTTRFTGFGYPRFFWAWDFYACNLCGANPCSGNSHFSCIVK